MAQRLAKKLLIVGWDAADWMMIDPLIASGKMPNLAGLIGRGVRSNLSTLEPRLSPLLWTSIATGKTPDKHGILNFVEPKPDGSGLRISSSTSRRTKALWNILTQNNMTSNVVGWYASHPAEPIRGSIVSNMLQEGEPANSTASWHLPAATVHPQELASQVAASRERANAVPRAVMERFVPGLSTLSAADPRVSTLAKLMAYAASIERATTVAMNSTPWDLTMAFFDAIDTVGHHFMQFLPPRMEHVSEAEARMYGGVMPGVYQWHDEALGRLLSASGPDTTVIVLSDHGFHSDHLRPVLVDIPPERRAELESSWHRSLGVLVMAGPGIKGGAQVSLPSILDVAPTALALLGLPVAADFDGRVLRESLSVDVTSESVASWDSIEGDSGLHSADVRQDPFEAVDAIKQLIDLGYMAALPPDVQGQLDLVSRESRFNLGVVLMSRHRQAEAVPLFKALSVEKPTELRYVLNLAQCQYAMCEFESAIGVLREYLAREPASSEARLLLAGALAMTGQDSQGLAEVKIVEKAQGNRPDLALPIGDCLYALRAFSQAKQYYESARSADATSTGAHIGLARVELGLGKFEEAAGHALDALEVSQALPEAHYLLGVALAWYGDIENAAKSFQLALMFEPNHLDAHRFAYLCFTKSGSNVLAAQHESRIKELVRERAAIPEFAFGPRAFAGNSQIEFR